MQFTRQLRTMDLSHHLSTESLARKPNPMKEVWKFVGQRPGMVSLATGDPDPDLNPIKRVDFAIEASAGSDEDLATASQIEQSMLTCAHDDPRSVLTIDIAMQYTASAGLAEAQRAVTELARFYHNPPNHVTCLTLGNSDAVTKCFRTFGNPGDSFLADEFSFSALTNAAIPLSIKWVPVRIDDGGLIPEDLERIMMNWDDERGPNPHVLYTVPCGQNPTGSTLSLSRREAIYELARRFDLVIIEDDPYYFLQYTSCGTADASQHVLPPSFVSMDIDGRVIRVDSFSKVIAPGMRLGWITANRLFRDHLLECTDMSTQHPHAFGQILITELLGPSGWQLAGFDQWTRSLSREYQRRRDLFMEEFKERIVSTGLASAQTPEAGMFVWVRIQIEQHPEFERTEAYHDGTIRCDKTNCRELMDRFFHQCLNDGLVVMPGSVFALSLISADASHAKTIDSISNRLNYVRLTFCSQEKITRSGLKRLRKSLLTFFSKETRDE